MTAARSFVITLLVCLSHASAAAAPVRIAVLTLFHPRQLSVEPLPSQVLRAEGGGHELVIGAAGPQTVSLLRSGDNVVLRSGALRMVAPRLRFAARDGGATEFVLAVPGKLRRAYRGQVEISTHGTELLAVVTMDVETAVASIVAAEAPPDAPLEALKAQAVVARSYLAAAGPRHTFADFCDTTHCQFLRRPPPPESAAARAAEATRGLVLAWRGKPIAAMYSASCGGRTRSLAEAGYPQRGYPYFAVPCPYCRRSPERWIATLDSHDAALLASHGERQRLQVARRLGWNAVPSASFAASPQGGEVTLAGQGRGHGLGLCQRGASAMAHAGRDFRSILAHYFPNTTLESLPGTQE